jgi:6-O-methylguanine DNA methyltransferase, DNA binding domain
MSERGTPRTAPRGRDRGEPFRAGSRRAALGDFAAKVLDVAEAIPPGRVMSYRDIAEYLGEGGPRQVGRVMALWGGGVSSTMTGRCWTAMSRPRWPVTGRRARRCARALTAGQAGWTCAARAGTAGPDGGAGRPPDLRVLSARPSLRPAAATGMALPCQALISTMPAATRPAAATRLIPKDSANSRHPIRAAKITLVSLIAATSASGARVCAQSTMP